MTTYNCTTQVVNGSTVYDCISHAKIVNCTSKVDECDETANNCSAAISDDAANVTCTSIPSCGVAEEKTVYVSSTTASSTTANITTTANTSTTATTTTPTNTSTTANITTTANTSTTATTTTPTNTSTTATTTTPTNTSTTATTTTPTNTSTTATTTTPTNTSTTATTTTPTNTSTAATTTTPTTTYTPTTANTDTTTVSDQSCNDNVVSGYYCIDETNYDTADDTDICDLKAPQANASASELVKSVDSAVDSAVSLDAGVMQGYTAALAQSITDSKPSEISGAVETLDKIFSKADGGIDKGQMTKVAQSAVGLIESALVTATTAPANGTNSNSTAEAEELLEKTLGALDTMGTAVAGALSNTDPAVTLVTDNFGMAVAVKDAGNSNGDVMDAGFSSVTLEDNSGITGDISLQASSFDTDPYATFATNTDSFKSEAAPVTMRAVGGGNSKVNFKAASKANVTIPRETKEVGADGALSHYNVTDVYSYMKVFVSIPGEENSYTVRCAMSVEPTDTEFDIELHITEDLNVTYNNLSATISYSNTTDELSIFINGRVTGTGIFYVHLSANQVEGSRKKRATGSGSSSGAAVYAPRVWNETIKAWVPSDEVEIDPSSTGEEVVFKSNFMGSMTSDLFIPPNTIDFDEVFDDLGAKTAENPYVLILVCLIAGLYFILLIPIRRLDVRDYKRNKPDDKFIYQITISIGRSSNQDFDTKLFCVIYGENGKTSPKMLEDGKRQNFQPNSVTNLVVTAKEDIGSVTHIHLWTRARDDRDSLYIEWISVVDTELQRTYTFLCNDWLSPVQTLCYGHEIFSKDMEEGKDFVSLVKDNTKSKMFDDHLWLSVARRPQKSNFSRVQRWSMCLSTLYLTMVVNAMWKNLLYPKVDGRLTPPRVASVQSLDQTENDSNTNSSGKEMKPSTDINLMPTFSNIDAPRIDSSKLEKMPVHVKYELSTADGQPPENMNAVVYPSVRYNGDPMDLEERQYIYNMDGYLMGPLRMKQNRDEDVDCDEEEMAAAARELKVYKCKSKEETGNWNASVFVSSKVDSFRPYPYVDTFDFVFLVIQIIWYLVLSYIVFSEVKALIKDGLKKYVSDPWHVVEILNAIFGLLTLLFFVLRSVAVVKAVEFMMNNRNDYVNFDPVMKWNDFYSMFLAAVLFIAIIQLLKPMDFSQQLTALKMSLSKTGPTLAWYVAILMGFLLLYSHAMVVAFGSQFGAFNDFFRAFYYLFGMLLGILKYTDLIEIDTVVLRILFGFFMVAGNFILLNLFISVINDGLAFVQQNPEEAEFDAAMASYLTRGPWNRELELYYDLLEDYQVTPIEDQQALKHQANVDDRADTAVEYFDLISASKLTDGEKRSMTVCKQHDRNEHTIRAAIKTIIWDMILSNKKMKGYLDKSPRRVASIPPV
ncbi:hypothetical protein EB796_003483 [Bugula neritina]|uniref:PLAT domain-containing protein n=1 Tax=Bugula neritina TaxID=10212 RepID=A0A7J7KHR3_BUGNE|nr:hypothetical protein EB796_003483 [Bugula neritina]